MTELMRTSKQNWNSDLCATLEKNEKSRTKARVRNISKKKRETAGRCKLYDRMPLPLLPNCASYVSRKNPLSIVDELFGTYQRTWKEGSEIIGFENTRPNAYVKYMFNRLGHLRDNQKNWEYWRTASSLLKNPVYITMCFNKVNEGWYKDMSMPYIKKIVQEVNEIIQDKKTKIEYKRVYIEKSNGKKRPLGVPSRAWRVYLNMWNNLIVWYRMDKIKSQHAYQPGLGVGTAWGELYSKLESSENIYEFDLKGFFDNVDLMYTKKRMIEMGIPEGISEYVYKMQRSIVELEEKDEVDESQHRKVIFDTDGTINQNLTQEEKDDLTVITEEKISKYISKGYTKFREKGVPQGAATSCGLSTINLEGVVSRNENIILYADDGLVFPTSPEVPMIEDQEAGVWLNSEKSKWVKHSGKWIGSIRFLGFRYIPAGVTDEGSVVNYPRLRGETRNGSKLEFDELRQFQCYLREEFAKMLKKQTEGWEAPKISLKGWIEREIEQFKNQTVAERIKRIFTTETGRRMQSCIFNKTWELNEPTDTEFAKREKSWLHLEMGSYLWRLKNETLFGILRAKKRFLEESIEKTQNQMKSEKAQAAKLQQNMNFLTYYLGEGKGSLFELSKASLFKFKSNWAKKRIKALSSEDRDLYLGMRKEWKEIFYQTKLDLFNTSSHASSDLLKYITKEVGWKHRQVKYIRVYGVKEKAIDFRNIKEIEKQRVRDKKRIRRRLRKEFLRSYRKK